MTATIHRLPTATLLEIDDDAWDTGFIRMLAANGYTIRGEKGKTPRIVLTKEGLERKRRVLEAQRRAITPN